MNRPLTIICLSVLLILFFISIATEHGVVSASSIELCIINFTATILFAIGGIAYCGFAAIHAIQRIADPCERATWFIIITFFTIFGTCIYFLTKYQNFRMIGKGTLIKNRRKLGLSELFQLTDEEKNTV